MKYVLLAYRDEKQWAALSAAERDAFESACLAHEQELRQSGRLVAVKGLQSSSTALTVRIVNSQVTLTGGPVNGPPGELIRLFFIRTRDLNEAIRVASKMPQAFTGPIEVRPVLTLDGPAESN
jgi:hypothetical protein